MFHRRQHAQATFEASPHRRAAARPRSWPGHRPATGISSRSGTRHAAAVERLDTGVIRRLARPADVERHALLIGPSVEHLRDEVRPGFDPGAKCRASGVQHCRNRHMIPRAANESRHALYGIGTTSERRGRAGAMRREPQEASATPRAWPKKRRVMTRPNTLLAAAALHRRRRCKRPSCQAFTRPRRPRQPAGGGAGTEARRWMSFLAFIIGSFFTLGAPSPEGQRECAGKLPTTRSPARAACELPPLLEERLTHVQ